MATGFPVKANYATGDVLTAANMNDLAGTLNYLDPTAKGDLFPASDGSTLTRLAVGTNGQVLTADSTQTTGIKWASAGGLTLLSTTSLSGSATTISSISGSYKNLVLFIKDFYSSVDNSIRITLNSDSTAANYQQFVLRGSGSTNGTYVDNATVGIDICGFDIDASNSDNFSYAIIPDYANATTKKVWNSITGFVRGDGTKAVTNNTTYYAGTVAAITSITFNASAGTFSSGSVELYGVN